MIFQSEQSKKLRTFFKVFTAALLILYPFLVLFGIDRLGASGIAIILIGITVIRGLLTSASMTVTEKRFYIVIAAFCFLTAVSNEGVVLYYYPVMMNLLIAMVFLISLREERPLIERLYGLTSSEPLPDVARIYMRQLTAVWGGLLVLNGLISAYTACCTSPRFWALYNGGIAYGLFAVIMGIEWVVRQHVKKKQDHFMRTTL